MSWIKDNKFIAALGGCTLVGVILLYLLGAHGATKYAEAKTQFDANATEATEYEKLPLYPKATNKDGKRKALDEYRLAVESIQNSFAPFQPKAIENISPQDFTNRIVAANKDVRKAFEDVGTKVPDAFFVGFEGYKNSLAPSNTTGILDYQLTAIKRILLALAKSKPSSLKNLCRPQLEEEKRETYVAGDAAARPLPLEICFVGPEKCAREFLSSIAKADDQYVVIRTLRISNEKKDPPKTSDAKFDKPAGSKPAGVSDLFGGGGAFVLPSDQTPPAPGGEKPAPAPKVQDSSRILSQVLGNEEIRVFLRLDVLEFLPAKKLP